jgi:hypothetical protein
MRLLASGVCLLGVLCSWIPAGAQRLSADPVGAALQVAVEELARYPSLCSDVPGASPLGVSDCSVLERATLGNPFRFYWPDSSFAGFETAEPASLLSHLGNKGVCFPVYADRRSLGTINVQFKADGATSVTNFGGEGLVDEYLRLADEAPVGPGQRVSVIQAGIGEYAVVEDGSTISWMIRLGATEGSPWQTPEAVAPAIKSAIAKRRQLPQEREGLRSQQSPGTARSDSTGERK